MLFRLILVFTLSILTNFDLSAGSLIRLASLEERLKAIPEISDVTKLNTSDHFTEKYEFWYEQFVNPNDTTSERFKQRVVLCHKDYVAPVVVGLEGYEIWTTNAYELTQILEGNQLSIEHRFFKDSKPESGIPWEFLTIENAAIDQHNIIQKIKMQIYPQNKFVSTGISKGGQPP